ncbi:MAG: hypothetical protein DRP67_04270 [Candidatus Omnitrophota bacterium]|nr:MAG: hypothetical protein DRP67_04270 [Candidatus Omnitrophota bacterium]HDN98112.1 RnfABCDGE type electron transport complex subunit G [bacterium]
MKRKEIIGGIIVLFLVTSLCGFLLAEVYKATSPKIEKQKRLEEEKLNKEIFPEGEKFEKVKKGDVEYFVVYDKKKRKIGRIYTIKSLGYGGYIYLKVGIDNNFKIKGVKILQHNETPGLGAKITEDKFLNQFKNIGIENLYLKKDNPKGKIDSITGATISSRAVVNGIRKLMEKIKNEKID